MIKPMIYVGLRVNGDKITSAFIDPLDKTEQLAFWGKIKWCVIGHYYKSEINGKHHTMKRSPEEIKEESEPEGDRLTRWEFENQAARQYRARQRASKKAEKFQFADLTVSQLQRKLEKIDWPTRRLIVDQIGIFIMSGTK